MVKKNFFEKNKIFLLIILVVLAFAYLGNKEDVINKSMSYSVESAPYGLDQNLRMVKSDYSQQGSKIVKTARLDVEVSSKDYANKKKVIDDLISQSYFLNKNEYSSRYGSDNIKTYHITLKVPSKDYDKIIDNLKEVGDIVYFSENLVDRTQNYQDYEAYIRTYNLEKERVEKLLEKATDVKDILQIENKLFEIQRKIDSYKQQLKRVEDDVEYSTIRFSLIEKPSVTQTMLKWTGIKEHLINIVNGINEVLVFITSNLGWILFGLILYMGYKLYARKG